MNLGSDKIMGKPAQSRGCVCSRAVSEDQRWTTVFSRTWCLFEAWGGNEKAPDSNPLGLCHIKRSLVMECSLFSNGSQKLSMVM